MKSRTNISARFRFFSLVAAVTCVAGLAVPSQVAARQDQATDTQFRVIKTLCGGKGGLHGTEFVMDDPKTAFHVPQDHEIVIAFEWQATPGTHHAVGMWRSPDGKVALTSDFELHSDSTFYVGTWTLAIPATIAPGLWALEAQIDGKAAGTQVFRIISDQPETVPAPPPLPAPDEIYQRASTAAIFITSLDQNGEVITRGLGFFIANGSVLTAFQVIDGASSLRLDFADGSSATVAGLLAWSRLQDWAILKVGSSNSNPLEQAPAGSWKVGDICYVLTSGGPNSRTIQTVNITGMEGIRAGGQRLTVSALSPEGWLGAPLLDRYGHVIGILGGAPALSDHRMGNWTTYIDLDQMQAAVNPTVLPLSAIPQKAVLQQPTTFAELAARGALMKALAVNPQAAIGVICADFRDFQGQTIVPVRPGANPSRAAGHFAVVITWGPNEKVRSLAQLRIYDLENHLLLQTAPSKIRLEPRLTTYSAWKIPTSSLRPGVYRIDLLIADQPQWRTFFRLSE